MRQCDRDEMTELPYQRAFHRIRAELFERPGIRLTADHLDGLTGAGRAVCQSVLDDLVRAGFLASHDDGSYGRYADTAAVAASMAAPAAK
jgi:hypothetical protein